MRQMVSFRLEQTLIDAVALAAQRRGKTKTAVMEAALEADLSDEIAEVESGRDGE